MPSYSENSSQVAKENEEPGETTDRVEQVCDIIGDWGRWQLNLTAFCITASTFTSLNGLVANFYQAPSDFECTEENFVSNIDRIFEKRKISFSVPSDAGQLLEGECNSCIISKSM